MKHKRYNLFVQWQKLPPIPASHEFKGVPIETLHDMGWRWTNGELGMGTGYFIPYFNMSKTAIPFAQVRHLTGDRRFTFLKDAEPVLYGVWNLPDTNKIFLVEGPSDCVVLEYCAVPYIGAPSAASGALVSKLADYCSKSGLSLVYAGDNDEAGDKLLNAIGGRCHYRVCQPPKKYKDWGDFFVAEGVDIVRDYCFRELFI